MITYDYYRIFYFAAQYKSFTKAAELLDNNQPNITRCMNCLLYTSDQNKGRKDCSQQCLCIQIQTALRDTVITLQTVHRKLIEYLDS